MSETVTELRVDLDQYKHRLRYLEDVIVRNNPHDIARERLMIQERTKHDKEMRKILERIRV